MKREEPYKSGDLEALFVINMNITQKIVLFKRTTESILLSFLRR